MARSKKKSAKIGPLGAKLVRVRDSAVFSGKLRDTHTGDKTEVPFGVELNDDGQIWFRADGYGDACSKEGDGYPVLIEWYDGELWVHVWGDINSDDPTMSIPLTGAKESRRRP